MLTHMSVTGSVPGIDQAYILLTPITVLFRGGIIYDSKYLLPSEAFGKW